jgi:hypothetical protein
LRSVSYFDLCCLHVCHVFFLNFAYFVLCVVGEDILNYVSLNMMGHICGCMLDAEFACEDLIKDHNDYY